MIRRTLALGVGVLLFLAAERATAGIIGCPAGQAINGIDLRTGHLVCVNVVASGTAAGGDLTGTYPNPTIAGGAVDGSKILDGSIASADLAPNSVTTDKLAAYAVGTPALQDGAVTASKLDPSLNLLQGFAANVALPFGSLFRGLIEVPGKFRLHGECARGVLGSQVATIRFENISEDGAMIWMMQARPGAPEQTTDFRVVSPAEEQTLATQSDLFGGSSNFVQAHIAIGSSAATLSAGIRADSPCFLTVQVVAGD